MNKKVLKILLIAFMLISISVMTRLVYAFFTSETTIVNEEEANIQAGTVSLTFADKESSIVAGSLSIGESLVKEFSIENTGTLDAAANLYWKNYINTYLEGGLSYSLYVKTDSKSEYELLLEDTPMDVSDEEITFLLIEKLVIPVSKTYDYKLVITYNHLDVDQNVDWDAKMYSQFELEGTENSRLPSGYQEVEYIESTGSQYLDTEYIANANIVTESKFMYTEDNVYTEYLFGARGASSWSGYQYFKYSDRQFWFDYKSRDFATRLSVEALKEYTFKTYSGVIEINGITYGTPNTSSYTSYKDNPMYIFSSSVIYTEGVITTQAIAHARCYYMKIYDGETLVRDYVPCYHKSDNVIGMYDLVNNKFYENKGDGVFLKGKNV